MGLGTTHDCWHGPYSAFGRWRVAIAKAAGVPLYLMDGFHGCPSPAAMEWAAPREGGPICKAPHGPSLHHWCETVDALLPIAWESLRPDVIHVLLNHSDCDGKIDAKDCGPLADRLTELLPLIQSTNDAWLTEKTQKFIDGFRLAASVGEDVEFH